MRFLLSSLLQIVWFGTVVWLNVEYGTASPAVTALFVAGEAGVSACLCSVIVRRYRQSTLTPWLTTVVAGYAVSHIVILTLLHLRHFPVAANAPHGPSMQIWMQLNLQVSLLVVLATTAGVLGKPRIRKFTEARLRRFTAAA